MKYYLIAGEPSGDLHGSNLMKYIKQKDPQAEFRFFGGDLMLEHDKNIVLHYKETAFMGIWEVLVHIFKIRRNFKICKKSLLEFKPNVLILIDYPGFNLVMSKFAHKKGIKTFYYISPKVWAWKQSRVKIIRKYVDRLFTILPFETAFYEKFGMEVNYFGNPIIDALYDKINQKPSREEFLKTHKLPDKPIIAILPGSRRQEINRCMPEMIPSVTAFPDYHFVIAGFEPLGKEIYKPFLNKPNVHILFGKTYDILQQAEAAIVTSGTATLETAMFKVPQVVVYKTSSFSYRVGIHFVKVKFISLVNLIADKEVVKEIIQFDMAENIKTELNQILNDISYKENMLKAYENISKQIGDPVVAEKVVHKMIAYLSEN